MSSNWPGGVARLPPVAPKWINVESLMSPGGEVRLAPLGAQWIYWAFLAKSKINVCLPRQ